MAVLAPSLSQVRCAQVLQSFLAVVLERLRGRDWFSPSLQWVAWKSGCVYQNQYFGSQAAKCPGWDIFCHFVTAVYFLSACLSVQHDARGFSCERGKSSLVFSRGFVGSANALNGCTPGKKEREAGIIPAGRCCASAKKTTTTKKWKLISHPCAKREEKQPLSSRKGWKKGEKRGFYISLADEGEGKYDHWVLRSSHMQGCILTSCCLCRIATKLGVLISQWLFLIF